MKLLLLTLALVGANATDVNPTCTAANGSGLIKQGVADATTNITCLVADEAHCKSLGKKFCPADTGINTNTCVASCAECKAAADGVTNGDKNKLNGVADTCAAYTAATCKTESASKSFVASTLQCVADCYGADNLDRVFTKTASADPKICLENDATFCTSKSKKFCPADTGINTKLCVATCAECKAAADGVTNGDKNKYNGAAATCALHTTTTCLAVSGTNHFCDATKYCGANCDGAEPPSASPAGVAAPGIFAALLAAVAAALRM